MKRRYKNRTVGHPLLSWDISGRSYHKSMALKDKMNDVRSLLKMAKVYGWRIDIKEELCAAYEALVVTNKEQEICWVNGGFLSMTGYSASFATGRTPTFLQGRNTSQEALQRIRTCVEKGIRFTETLTNYRKNGNAYACHLSIIPLRNSKAEIMHFLALEKEIK